MAPNTGLQQPPALCETKYHLVSPSLNELTENNVTVYTTTIFLLCQPLFADMSQSHQESGPRNTCCTAFTLRGQTGIVGIYEKACFVPRIEQA